MFTEAFRNNEQNYNVYLGYRDLRRRLKYYYSIIIKIY